MTGPTERELLDRAQKAIRDMAKAMISVSPHLKKPFSDAPNLTPWDLIKAHMSVGYDLGHEIQRHLRATEEPSSPREETP